MLSTSCVIIYWKFFIIARNHPSESAEDFSEPNYMEPHMIKMPLPDDQNMKRLTHDIKFAQKR